MAEQRAVLNAVARTLREAGQRKQAKHLQDRFEALDELEAAIKSGDAEEIQASEFMFGVLSRGVPSL